MNPKDEILEWLYEQLAKAEKALSARVEMEHVWASGTSQAWRKAGCRMTQSERLNMSARHSKIAIKCRRDVEMFKAVITQLQKNEEFVSRDGARDR